MNGICGLWPSWQEVWKSTMAALAGPFGIPYQMSYGWGKIQEYLGNPGVKTPDDISAAAFSDYQSGKMTYEQYLQILTLTAQIKKNAGQSSGLAQFGNVLKWVAIIGGIGLGAYLLAPTIRKAVALIPIPEPKPA